MNVSTLFLALTGVIAIFIALVVFLAHNVRKASKILFLAVSLALTFWQGNIYIADQVTTHLRFWNNLVFLWPSLAIVGIFLFSLLLEVSSAENGLLPQLRRNIFMTRIMFGSLVAQLGLLPTQQLFSKVTYDISSRQYVYIRGWAYPMYTVLILVQLAIVVWYLVKAYRGSQAQSEQRKALKTILVTIAIVSLYSVLTNIVLPILTGSQQHISWGILSIDIFASGFALSIIRYRFLDIRSYAFTAAAYIVALLVVATVYVSAASILATHLFHITLSGSAKATLSLLTLIIAISFQSLQKYFNRLTARLFFQDAYEPQELFNELNQSLVGAIHIDSMLHNALDIIQSSIKSEYVSASLFETDSSPARTISTSAGKTISLSDLKAIQAKNLPSKFNTIVATSSLDHSAELRKIFNRNSIEILSQLHGLDSALDGLGYLMFGAKKSGKPYTLQDLHVIEAVTNELVIAIQNALRFEEIEKFNETLQKTVEERTRSLQHANDKLRKLDQTKDDFISMASHQLRTPLTSVKGYVSMVLDGDVGPLTNQQKKLLTQSFISAQRMVYLIADLLNVSRLRTGKFVIEPIQCNLANVIDEEVSQLVETAKSRNLELSFKKPKRFPLTLVDETKIRQVVMNFIDNAIYYTPSGGHIVVKLEELPRSIEVTVSDDGIGVPKAAQHKLFTKFYRADNARLARPDGTGLGIYMAKKIIAAQGGAIIFKSHPGKGSTFGFTFSKATVIVPPKER